MNDGPNTFEIPAPRVMDPFERNQFSPYQSTRHRFDVDTTLLRHQQC